MADSYDAGFWDAYAQLGGGYNANAGMEVVASRAAAGAREWEKAAKAWRAEAERQAKKAQMNNEKYEALGEAWRARLEVIGREVQRRVKLSETDWQAIKHATQGTANARFIEILQDYGWQVTQDDLSSPRAR